MKYFKNLYSENLETFWYIKKTPFRVYQRPSRIFRRILISSRRTLTKPRQYSANRYSKTTENANGDLAASPAAIIKT